MITIHLHNVIIQAGHGIYEEERQVANTFEVNLDVMYDDKKADFDSIRDTISYTELFSIVKKKMESPVPLLEKLCQGIIRKIRHQYPAVKKIDISIYKLRAPIENFQGKVGVSMQKNFDN